MKPQVLFIDSVHPLLHTELEKHGFVCTLDYDLSRTQIENTLHRYHGIVIRSKLKLDPSLLDKASHLRFIARAGAGMENIDVAYAEKKGITCLHAPEGNKDAVAEHALGMLLCLFNNLCRANREVREGKWIREGNRGIELSGKTVGIIGYGNMGSAFAQRLKGFDVSVLAFDKYKKGFSTAHVKEASLEMIFEQSDVLSLHVPLTPETTGMVNDAFLRSFRKNIYLINTARGKVVQTQDLVKHLESGHVLGACLDVLEYEDVSFEKLSGPGPRDVFYSAFQYLIQSDRLMLSPHIAGWTHESNEKIAAILAKKIIALFPATKS